MSYKFIFTFDLICVLQQAQIHYIHEYKPAKKSKIGIIPFVTSFEVSRFLYCSVH